MDLKNDCLEVYRTVSEASVRISERMDALSKSGSRNLADVMKLLPPRNQAELSLTLAYAVVTMYGISLCCDGTDENRHPLVRERDRLLTYIAKLRTTSGLTTHKRKLEVDVDVLQRVVRQHL
jgi:hypothetical protein